MPVFGESLVQRIRSTNEYSENHSPSRLTVACHGVEKVAHVCFQHFNVPDNVN